MNTKDKINQDFLKQYSAVFSDKLLNQAYDNKQHLTGKDILNLSSIKQLNLFVIKSFFIEWQEEVKRLESPLFDYKSREVRKSMIDFMNVLSQHILIEQKDLKPYVEKALADTILLASDLQAFLQAEFADKKSSRVSPKFIKSQLKYIVFHKQLLVDFLASVEGESVREALNKSEFYFEDVDSAKTEEDLIGSLSQYLVLEKGDLYIPLFQHNDSELIIEEQEGMIEVADSEEEMELAASSSDYFDSVSDSEPDHEETDEIRIGNSEEEMQDKRHFEEQSEKEKHLHTQGLNGDEIAAIEEEEVTDEPEGKEEGEITTENSAAEKFEVDQKTLAELQEEQKIESVFEAISINHRYMFLQELFDGNNELFTTALKDIDVCSTFDEAVEALVQNYAKEFYWDMNSDEVKELLKVVYRKFRN